MAEKLTNEKAKFFITTNRIEAFSDGVFAIIITLLALELRIPKLSEDVPLLTNLRELARISPKFISFILSFLFLAIFWVNHHQLYYSLKETDRSLLWYNIHALFWMCLIPFPTAMIGSHPTMPIAFMFLAFVLMMATFASYLMRRYAYFKADLLHENISNKSLSIIMRKNLAGVVLYLGAIVAAAFSVYISAIIFIIVLGMFFIPDSIELRQKRRQRI